MNAVALGLEVSGVPNADDAGDAEVVVVRGDDPRVPLLLAAGRLVVILGEPPPGVDAGIDLLASSSLDEAARLLAAVRQDPRSFDRVRAMGRLTGQRLG